MQALERSFSCSFPLSSNAAKWNDEKTNVLQRLWFHTSSTQSHASAQWRFDTIQDKTALLLQINGDRAIHERDNMRCFSDKRKGDTRITIRKKKYREKHFILLSIGNASVENAFVSKQPHSFSPFFLSLRNSCAVFLVGCCVGFKESTSLLRVD